MARRNKTIETQDSLSETQDGVLEMEEVTMEEAMAESKEAESSRHRTIMGTLVDVSHYERNTVEVDGKKVPKIDIGDDIAVTLRSMTLDDVYEFVAAQTEIPVGVLKERYSHLNHGQQRMNLGNRLRGHAEAEAEAEAEATAEAEV